MDHQFCHMKQATLIELRTLLADLYQDVTSIRRIVYDAGIDASRINLNATPLDSWHMVLTEAEKRGQIAALLEIVKADYRTNPNVQHLYSEYYGAAQPTPLERKDESEKLNVLAKKVAWLRQYPVIYLGSLAFMSLLFGFFWWNLDKFRPAPAPSLCPADRRCLLVADFAPTDHPLAVEITRKIKTELDSQEHLSPHIFAVRQSEAVTTVDAARQLATREQALVVVWGEIFTQLKELKIFFALTDQFGVDESREMRPYRAEFFGATSQQIDCQQQCFENVTTLGTTIDQISVVVAYTAAGLLHYANDQPEAANRDFKAALLCSGQPIDLTLTDPAITPIAPVTLTHTLSISSALPDCFTDQAIPEFNPVAIYYYAGKAKIRIGDYMTAIAYLQHAATLNSKDPAIPLAIATAYQSWLEQEDSLQVKDYLNQARQRANGLRIELLPQGVPQQIAKIDYELGLIAELAGDLQTSLEKYAAAADSFGRRNPDAYVSLIALGRVQRMAKQVEASIETLQQALDLDSSVPWAYLELAQVYAADRTQAEIQLQAARQVAPNQSAIAITEADLCVRWQDFACAEAAYTRVLEQQPNSGWLQGRIGDFYRLSKENWEQAATHYELAVQMRSNDPWAHDRLAFVYKQLGNYADAAKHYGVTLDLLHPQNRIAEYYCELGQAQELVEQPQAALVNYRICVDGLKDEAQRAIVKEWIATIEAAQDSQ